MRRSHVILFALLLAAPASAQEHHAPDSVAPALVDAVTPDRPISGTGIFIGAMFGSWAGMALGSGSGAVLTDSFNGAIGAGTAGSAVGATLGAYMGSGGRARPATLLAAGLLGVFGAIIGADIAGDRAEESGPVIIGWVVGQGAITALITTLVEK